MAGSKHPNPTSVELLCQAKKQRCVSQKQLESNRARSKKYYEEHREHVLAKLRANYLENREKERLRQREKYLRLKARKMHEEQQARAAATSPLDICLCVSFILN
ncbi:hypothetical protein SPRG_17039 [Saprolegnia parasitica CBS 223.65]|uniref:Uncharacterized protein n=1 Tax=Saprolegnia parasitica (strain CBS 223.65) TaxID=695850 RepID=A0A067BH44_SAPPC|nr:hypothetical protein SPRG_17039 [Saprolegnia parasitica CBS 223.65]KDO17498.1 hypothetical protein SPRG_17039 [Saprolegnia parasitica CBS 223.65]|eukprot:XP_012211793.1 hypothetical protein SPRG_17039 [Saprolegnia parasitica CBS 223.65]